MDIKFKTPSEAEKFLQEIDQEVADIDNLLRLQTQMVSASFKQKLKLLADTFVLDLNDTSLQNTGKGSALRVSELNLDSSNIKIPGGIRKLAANYSLLEQLVEKEEALSNAETSIKLTFKDDTVQKPLLIKISQLKARIQREKEDVQAFLNNIATDNVPPSFNKYVFSVAQAVVNHVNLTEDQYDVFYYISLYKSCLLYSAYIELRNIENNEGDKVKAMYASIHWCIGDKETPSDIKVSLGYNWEPPAELYHDSRIVVTSTNSTINVMDKLLDAEDFAVAIGTEPLQNRLGKGIKLQNIDLNSLSMKGKIKKMEVEPNSITVYLKRIPKADLENTQAEVYLGVRKFFDRKTKLRMSIAPNGLTLTFTVTNFADSKQFTNQDIEYFESWGLSYKQIKKIETILGN